VSRPGCPHVAELVCEMFVEEVHDGRCHGVRDCWARSTAQGVHARRVGLRLVPDWRCRAARSFVREAAEPRTVLNERIPLRSAFAASLCWANHRRLLGRCTRLSTTRRVARLPGRLSFMSRVVRIEARWARARRAPVLRSNRRAAEAWYFVENGIL